MVSLVISDVIGNCLEYIASGPTVSCKTVSSDVIALLHKYHLWAVTPQSMQHYIKYRTKVSANDLIPMTDAQYSHVQNVVIGDISIATLAATTSATQRGYESLVWSHIIQYKVKLGCLENPML